MSSLAATRADGYYYPQNWTPSQVIIINFQINQGSLNKFHKSNPLGDRARKIKDGILIIRLLKKYKN